MENTAPETHQDFDLLTYIVKGCRSIGKGIANFFIWLYKTAFWFVNVHFRYFFIFLVVYGFIFTWAFTHRKEKKPTCSGDAVVYCNGFDNLLLDQELQAINKFAAPAMAKHLAVKLGLTEDECKPFVQINLGVPRDLDNDGLANKYILRSETRFAANTFEEQPRILRKREEGDIYYLQPIETRIPDMGLLQIEYKSDSLPMFHKFAEALISYLNSRPCLLAQHAAYINGLTAEREACDRQIHLIDSFQRVLYFEKKNVITPKNDYTFLSLAASSDITGNELKKLAQPPLFYEDILALTEKRNELDRRINLSGQPVSFLSDFQPTMGVKYHSWMLPTLVRCFLLGLILGVLIDFRKVIWSHIRKERRLARGKAE